MDELTDQLFCFIVSADMWGVGGVTYRIDFVEVFDGRMDARHIFSRVNRSAQLRCPNLHVRKNERESEFREMLRETVLLLKELWTTIVDKFG